MIRIHDVCDFLKHKSHYKFLEFLSATDKGGKCNKREAKKRKKCIQY